MRPRPWGEKRLGGPAPVGRLLIYTSLEELGDRIVSCSLCPRLARYRVGVSLKDPGESYWARPVPGYGDPGARILVVGQAPAARGGNRTGRVFTGDETSQNLMRALHEAGLASQPYSISRNDGLRLVDVYLTASVKCAPPENRPLPVEFENCRPFLEAEIAILRRARVFAALGSLAWASTLKAISRVFGTRIPRTGFRHGLEVELGETPRGRIWALASYHPSPRNTRTGRLSHEMLVSLFKRARELASQ